MSKWQRVVCNKNISFFNLLDGGETDVVDIDDDALNVCNEREKNAFFFCK